MFDDAQKMRSRIMVYQWRTLEREWNVVKFSERGLTTLHSLGYRSGCGLQESFSYSLYFSELWFSIRKSWFTKTNKHMERPRCVSCKKELTYHPYRGMNKCGCKKKAVIAAEDKK